MNNSNNEKNERAKDAFSNFWKTTSDISKKAVEGAKEFAEQAKKIFTRRKLRNTLQLQQMT